MALPVLRLYCQDHLSDAASAHFIHGINSLQSLELIVFCSKTDLSVKLRLVAIDVKILLERSPKCSQKLLAVIF